MAERARRAVAVVLTGALLTACLPSEAWAQIGRVSVRPVVAGTGLIVPTVPGVPALLTSAGALVPAPLIPAAPILPAAGPAAWPTPAPAAAFAAPLRAAAAAAPVRPASAASPVDVTRPADERAPEPAAAGSALLFDGAEPRLRDAIEALRAATDDAVRSSRTRETRAAVEKHERAAAAREAAEQERLVLRLVEQLAAIDTPRAWNVLRGIAESPSNPPLVVRRARELVAQSPVVAASVDAERLEALARAEPQGAPLNRLKEEAQALIQTLDGGDRLARAHGEALSEALSAISAAETARDDGAATLAATRLEERLALARRATGSTGPDGAAAWSATSPAGRLLWRLRRAFVHPGVRFVLEAFGACTAIAFAASNFRAQLLPYNQAFAIAFIISLFVVFQANSLKVRRLAIWVTAGSMLLFTTMGAPWPLAAFMSAFMISYIGGRIVMSNAGYLKPETAYGLRDEAKRLALDALDRRRIDELLGARAERLRALAAVAADPAQSRRLLPVLRRWLLHTADRPDGLGPILDAVAAGGDAEAARLLELVALTAVSEPEKAEAAYRLTDLRQTLAQTERLERLAATELSETPTPERDALRARAESAAALAEDDGMVGRLRAGEIRSALDELDRAIRAEDAAAEALVAARLEALLAGREAGGAAAWSAAASLADHGLWRLRRVLAHKGVRWVLGSIGASAAIAFAAASGSALLLPYSAVFAWAFFLSLGVAVKGKTLKVRRAALFAAAGAMIVTLAINLSWPVAAVLSAIMIAGISTGIVMSNAGYLKTVSAEPRYSHTIQSILRTMREGDRRRFDEILGTRAERLRALAAVAADPEQSRRMQPILHALVDRFHHPDGVGAILDAVAAGGDEEAASLLGWIARMRTYQKEPDGAEAAEMAAALRRTLAQAARIDRLAETELSETPAPVRDALRARAERAAALTEDDGMVGRLRAGEIRSALDELDRAVRAEDAAAEALVAARLEALLAGRVADGSALSGERSWRLRRLLLHPLTVYLPLVLSAIPALAFGASLVLSPLMLAVVACVSIVSLLAVRPLVYRLRARTDILHPRLVWSLRRDIEREALSGADRALAEDMTLSRARRAAAYAQAARGGPRDALRPVLTTLLLDAASPLPDKEGALSVFEAWADERSERELAPLALIAAGPARELLAGFLERAAARRAQSRTLDSIAAAARSGADDAHAALLARADAALASTPGDLLGQKRASEIRRAVDELRLFLGASRHEEEAITAARLEALLDGKAGGAAAASARGGSASVGTFRLLGRLGAALGLAWPAAAAFLFSPLAGLGVGVLLAVYALPLLSLRAPAASEVPHVVELERAAPARAAAARLVERLGLGQEAVPRVGIFVDPVTPLQAMASGMPPDEARRLETHNAMAFGDGLGRRGAVGVGEALLAEDEGTLESVVAHELGHLLRGDPAALWRWKGADSVARRITKAGLLAAVPAALVAGWPLVLIAALGAAGCLLSVLAGAAMSRAMETRADRFAASLVGSETYRAFLRRLASWTGDAPSGLLDAHPSAESRERRLPGS